MFGIKKDKDKPTTLEEVRKAYEDLSDEDKKSFHQSIADRIHESVGEQKAENGQKDEQSAADREHEALGEEHADGEGETEKLGETDEGKAEEKAETAAEEKHEEAEKPEEKGEATHDNYGEVIKALDARIARLEANAEKAPKRASEEESDYLTALERKYNR